MRNKVSQLIFDTVCREDRTELDRTETSPGSGHIFEIFLGQVGSGIKSSVRSGSGHFLPECHIFFQRISKDKVELNGNHTLHSQPEKYSKYRTLISML